MQSLETAPLHATPVPYAMIQPGGRGTVRVRIGPHEKDLPAVCLAVMHDRALVEYRCPNDTTALSFCLIYDLPVWERTADRPSSYQQLLKPWLAAVVRQYGSWIGRTKNGPVPGPAELLKRRFKA